MSLVPIELGQSELSEDRMIGYCPYCNAEVPEECTETLTGAKRKIFCSNPLCRRRFWAWVDESTQSVMTMEQIDEEVGGTFASRADDVLPTATTQDNSQAHSVRGYMCTTAWHHHLCGDQSGTEIYPSVLSLKNAHPNCWEECGIVEVEITISSVVVEGAPD
jgi:hypothetical protein